jgi:hypothetical protein
VECGGACRNCGCGALPTLHTQTHTHMLSPLILGKIDPHTGTGGLNLIRRENYEKNENNRRKFFLIVKFSPSNSLEVMGQLSVIYCSS